VRRAAQLGELRAGTAANRPPRARLPCARRVDAGLFLLTQQPHQQRLLRVQAVLRLVPDHALRAVDDLGIHLVAAVGGQAVDEDRVGSASAMVSCVTL
jgi:hypothetical protein